MMPLLLVASITTALVSGTGSQSVVEQVSRDANNGEFISKYYPPQALKRGEQGKVTFRLTIEPDGSLGSCDVTQSSGFSTLDHETCEIMVHYARLKPVRNEEGRTIRATQDGYIVWRLPSGTKIASSATSKAMPKPDQVICKRTQTTGSLIGKTKQCMTRSEWARTEQNTRDQLDNLQGRGNFDCKSTGAC